jgi:hypothetical protein
MAIKTLEITRNIRDAIYDKIKNMTKEEQVKFYRMQAFSLNKKLQKRKKAVV